MLFTSFYPITPGCRIQKEKYRLSSQRLMEDLEKVELESQL
jgi:hypothetical protein